MTMPYPPPVAPRAYRTSGMAIAGFVLAFFSSPLGLIFSIIGRNECKRSGGTVGGDGLALAGIIISIISIALAIFGMLLGAIAIPAFMDSMSKAKRVESDVMLMKIQHAAERYAVENGAFPRDSAPLTPAVSCCERPSHKCLDAQSWQVPAWQQLDFSIDHPHYFQYSYESDGKSFVAKAVGDLDCDGDTVTYEISGTLDSAGTTFSKRGPIGRD